MPLSEDDVREILRLIDESETAELRVETETFSLHVVRDVTSAEVGVPSGAGVDDGLLTVSSPMIGTFYRAEAPGAPPFVDLGTHVEPESVVCIIEVMKMMNPIHAGVAGTIVDVCAGNGEPVEYGTVLFRIEPDGRAV